MNKRKAKKAVKKKHGITTYPAHAPPRYVDWYFTEFKKALRAAIENAILYGQGAKR